MTRKPPPRLGKLTPKLKAAEFRTVLPKPRTFANRIAADPLLGFYQTPEWRALRSAVIKERGPICEKCGAGGRIYVDHIQELRDGGAPLDRSNLMCLCSSCHVIKSGQARARRFGIA